MAKEIRTRFAPSPTGYLHIGGARTTLFSWLFARHNGGKFVLRIEDTDLERSQKKFEDDILEGLKWLGFDWDEFYRQSDRLPIYSKYIQKLLDEGKAFWCYHTEEELEGEKRQQAEKKKIQRHVCEYKEKKEAKADGRRGIIRLAVDEDSTRKVEFNDIIRGHVEFEVRLLGDFSLAKDIEVPLYNFAVVIDDYEMAISHVIRGEEHLSNTPRQILIQEALGLEMPKYAHLPLMLGEDKSKLSKRHGSTSLRQYKEQGYLPEAIFNFLALMGWTPPGDGEKEILTKSELIEFFDLDKVHKSGAVFDIKKLDWMNAEYIKKLTDAELVEKLILQLGNEEISKDYIFKMAPMVRERIKKFSDISEFNYFFGELSYAKELLMWKMRTAGEINKSLLRVQELIEEIGTDDKALMREKLDELGKEMEDRGLVYWPLRVAVSGLKNSADPVDISWILGKEKTLERVRNAIEKL
jgi:glutamyl-tRNA synthetase